MGDPMTSLLPQAIAPEWKSVSTRWGHPLHSLCSYMAMFPPSLPHYFIHKFTEPGDTVLDPFSGRGTTPLQACLNGRVGLGNDLNPLAYVLTRAKVDLPSEQGVLARIAELEGGYTALGSAQNLREHYGELSRELTNTNSTRDEPAQVSLLPDAESSGGWYTLWKLLKDLREIYAQESEIRMPHLSDHDYNDDPLRGEISYSRKHHDPIWIFYHPETLRQLAYLKTELRATQEDVFIAATILGIMHGRGQHYLSVPMPNTFSMTPRYVLKYVHENQLIIPRRNVFDALRRKMSLITPWPNTTGGLALHGDVRDLPDNLAQVREVRGGVNLIVTSPPYLKVIKYGQYNWIRLWFLDGSRLAREFKLEGPLSTGDTDSLDRRVDATLDDGHALEAYMQFMKDTMEVTRGILAPDGVAVFVIGDVDKGGDSLRLAEEVWEDAAKPAGLILESIIAEDIAQNRKVTKIWGDRRGRATVIDRLLIVSRGKARTRKVPVPW